jgi:hypothetical protein
MRRCRVRSAYLSLETAALLHAAQGRSLRSLGTTAADSKAHGATLDPDEAVMIELVSVRTEKDWTHPTLEEAIDVGRNRRNLAEDRR